MDGAICDDGKFSGSFLENFFPTAANVDGSTELQESACHGFAESCAAAGNQDTFFAEKIVSKHVVRCFQ